MGQLARADLEAVLDITGEAGGCRSVAAVRELTLHRVRELVAADLFGYNEVDVRTGDALVVLDPVDATFDGIDQTLARVAHEHPLITRQARGDLRAATISDHLTARQLHRLELYADLYRRLGAEDQLAFGLPGQVVVGVAMNRARRSFTARDRAVLEAVRPALTHAYEQARAWERARAALSALGTAAARAGAAVVLLERDDRLDALPADARALLDDAVTLDELRAWLDGDPRREPLRVEVPGRTLTIRLLDALLLIEERRTGPDPDALRALGLTRREAQVLGLAALGLGDRDIAQELTISVRTVRKHVEHIYDKLGAHTRAEAVARAYGAAPEVR